MNYSTLTFIKQLYIFISHNQFTEVQTFINVIIVVLNPINLSELPLWSYPQICITIKNLKEFFFLFFKNLFCIEIHSFLMIETEIVYPVHIYLLQ